MERGQRSDAALRLRCSQLRRAEAEAEDSVLAGSRRGSERSLPATVGIPRLSELMPGVQVQYSCYSGHGLSRQGRPQGRSEAQLPNWLTQRFFVYTLPRKKAAWLSCFAAGVPNCSPDSATLCTGVAQSRWGEILFGCIPAGVLAAAFASHSPQRLISSRLRGPGPQAKPTPPMAERSATSRALCASISCIPLRLESGESTWLFLLTPLLPHAAMERATSCPAKELRVVRGNLIIDPSSPRPTSRPCASSPTSPISPGFYSRPVSPVSPLVRDQSAGSLGWASRSVRKDRERRAVTPGSVRAVRRSLARLEVEPLPSLAKGALRHRQPQASVAQAQESHPQSPQRHECQMDWDAAEHLGRQMLKNDAWTKRIFEEFDGAACGYLWPAEFAALSFRFEQAMGGFLGRFGFDFNDADINMEGRISLSEWQEYAKELTTAFGEIRCKVAVQRILGSRKAELRRKVKHVWLFDGYDFQPSVRLLEMCSKGHKNPSIVQDVRSALASKADPNAGLASPSFNNYTPLIFLAMTPACANGPLVATAMELLILAKADVHRECGQMFTGRLLPLRFAARAQNEYGLEALQKHVNLGDVFQTARGVQQQSLEKLRLTEEEEAPTCYSRPP
ncbi:hypothetical protein AK812_SmicGene11380 [Symbiodinium microadriaticum]|uniref:EF-hand domain-containing protein n=1 Tax=Symbiodinium microadriaticum TaxID=2951 RepID=A0A1Q9EDC6_SYMMI|nr:hypothetical protein AK812_SmicGene11380 [Symbiodinium microadriaticum]